MYLRDLAGYFPPPPIPIVYNKSFIILKSELTFLSLPVQLFFHLANSSFFLLSSPWGLTQHSCAMFIVGWGYFFFCYFLMSSFKISNLLPWVVLEKPKISMQWEFGKMKRLIETWGFIGKVVWFLNGFSKLFSQGLFQQTAPTPAPQHTHTPLFQI